MLWDPNKDKQVEPTLDEVGKIMHLAADYLETHRWGQGDFVLANGAVCLMGALIKVEIGKVHTGDYYDEYGNPVCVNADRALNRVRDYLIVKSSKYLNPYDWNDDPKRKKAEVIAILREAASFK